MFKTLLGFDLGSKNTRIAVKNGCFTEPTLLAFGAGRKNGSASVGGSARYEEFGRVSPIKNGCCVSEKLLALMLSEFAKNFCGRGSYRRVKLHIALNKTMPFQRVRAFEKAAEAAGFCGIKALEKSLMGALGAGMDPGADRAGLIVDIGAQTVCCAAVGFGGIICECSESFGSELADRAIQNYFAAAHRVQIGARMAELIKQNLHRLAFTVDGRSLEDGLPRSVKTDAGNLREAALGSMRSIVAFTSDMLALLQPEVCADALESGIVLIGGGAKMHGLSELFESELGLRTRAAENAETAAAEGMRRYLFSEHGIGRERLLYELASLPEETLLAEDRAWEGKLSV